MVLIISHFGFEGGALVLIAQVLGHCLAVRTGLVLATLREHIHTRIAQSLHLTFYSKIGGNLGLVLKMKKKTM